MTPIRDERSAPQALSRTSNATTLDVSVPTSTGNEVAEAIEEMTGSFVEAIKCNRLRLRCFSRPSFPILDR